MTTITLSVDSEVAEFYEQISEVERNQISKLVAQELRRVRAARVIEIVRETSQMAKSRGMTPEILEELLRDESDEA